VNHALLPHQVQYAKDKLMSLVENSFGTDFENLFHRLMQLRRPDYVVVRTHGKLGDLGADGLGLADRTLFACYAPQSVDTDNIRKKFRGDLDSAMAQRSGEFDTFVFVHNDRRGGLHPVITKELPAAQAAYPAIGIQQLGPFKLWAEALYLDRVQMEIVLDDRIPIELVVYEIGMADIEPLLKHLEQARVRVLADAPIVIPSIEKADYNSLGEAEQLNLQTGRTFAYLVEEYYRNLLDLHERDEVATGFQTYYRRMRAEHGDDADRVMFEMEGYVFGQARPYPKRELAGRAVLAYFFDQCDIFEVPPPGWGNALSEGGMTT
jgi:hypothetical protein